MLKVGLLLAFFVLLLVVTWLAGKHHAETNAVLRILRRHGYQRKDQSFSEENASELKLRIDQASRRLKLGATELKRLRKLS